MNVSDAKEIEDAIKEIIAEVAPDVRFVPKYGGEVLAHIPDDDKKFVGGIFIYKNHVSMEFSEGASFKDCGGLLHGGGQKRRHLKFESVDDVKVGVIKGFLKQALG